MPLWLLMSLLKKASMLKILFWDGNGLCLFTNYVHSYYTSFSFS